MLKFIVKEQIVDQTVDLVGKYLIQHIRGAILQYLCFLSLIKQVITEQHVFGIPSPTVFCTVWCDIALLQK